VKSYSLTSLVRRLIVDPDGFAKAFPHPWLVWSPPEDPNEDKILSTSASEQSQPDFVSGEPVALAVVKTEPNAFPFGITIGHAENNDVVVRHPGVSRFHAYLQNNQGRFFLVDADSKYGTFLGGNRLTPSKPTPLPSSAEVQLGAVTLRFFDQPGFAAWLDAQSRS